MRPAILKSDFNSDHFYKYYKNNYENIVDKKLYGQVCRDFFDIVINQMIYNNESFKLPFGLGSMFIGKKKYKKFEQLPINWKATKELWEKDENAKENKILVKHLNRHSDGYVYRYIWSKKTAIFKNKTIYKFKPSRKNARLLASIAQNPKSKIDFFEIE